MLKCILSLILLFLLNMPVSAEMTLTGGVLYTVESARIDAFTDIPYQISVESFADKLTDVNNLENIDYLRRNKQPRGRYLTLFSNDDYCVIYKNSKNYAYYYSSIGRLIIFESDIGSNYPKKELRYDVNGKLDSVGLIHSCDEQYVFDLNKKLIMHWIGKNGYNEKGELIKTRKSKILK